MAEGRAAFQALIPVHIANAKIASRDSQATARMGGCASNAISTFQPRDAPSTGGAQVSNRTATSAVPNQPTSSANAFTHASRAHHSAIGPAIIAESVARTRAISSSESDIRTSAWARCASISSTSTPIAAHASIGATAATARIRVCAIEMRGAPGHAACGRPRASRNTAPATSSGLEAASADRNAIRPARNPMRRCCD